MKKTLWLLMGFLLLLCLQISANAIIVGTDVTFQSGNEHYTILSPMNFNHILVNDTWIRMDNINWNISSSNTININISHITDNIYGVINGENALTFNAYTSSGNVFFNISGFIGNRSYDIYRDYVLIEEVTSDINGVISFSNNIWSEHTFQINALSISLNINGTDFINEPWNTSFNPYTDLFDSIVGNGSVFFLIPFVALIIGLYYKSDNPAYVAAFMIIIGTLLGTGLIFAGMIHMAIVFYIFAALGFTWLVIKLYLNL